MNKKFSNEEFLGELQRGCIFEFIGDFVSVCWVLMNDGSVSMSSTLFDKEGNAVIIFDHYRHISLDDAYEIYEKVVSLSD